MRKPFLFRCPATGLNVQGYSEEEQLSNGRRRYEGVHCLACRSFHIVNPDTGRLLSEETGRPPFKLETIGKCSTLGLGCRRALLAELARRSTLLAVVISTTIWPPYVQFASLHGFR